MVDSRENDKFDLGVEGLTKYVLMFLFLMLLLFFLMTVVLV